MISLFIFILPALLKELASVKAIVVAEFVISPFNVVETPSKFIWLSKKLNSKPIYYWMSRNFIDIDQIKNFPEGVRSVYVNGKRVRKEDIEIERSYIEVSSSKYDIADIPQHINYLPKKYAAEYLGVSESTLTRYHVKGKLKWITRRNRTPIYKRETLDNFKEKNRGKLLS